MFFGGDPFEHFHGGHGGGGRGGGSARAPRADVDTTKLYETLGVEKEATSQQIKKAYRKLAVKHHVRCYSYSCVALTTIRSYTIVPTERAESHS